MCFGGMFFVNPFSSKSEKNVPATLLEIKPTLSVKQLWSVQVGSSQNYVFSPAIVGQQLYVAAADGTLLKIDAASGRADWRINAGVRLTGGVGANARTVVVAGDKGGLFAFDNEGKLRWKNQDSTEILSAPALSDSFLVVRSIDNKISAYDVETGVRKWVVERTLPALTLRAFPGLVVAGDQVIIALPGGRMAALSLANGGLRWEAVVGEPKGATELERVADVSGFPAIIGRDVCASAYQGRVGCFDLNTGAVRWVKKLSSEVGAGVDERFVFAADVGGAVTAYNRESGSSAWKNDKLANRRLSALTKSDPMIDLIKQELTQKRLRTYLTEQDLKKSLTYLYRSSRIALEENGANTLYLALGLLRWYETEHSERPRYAPILLLPVEMIRKSVSKDILSVPVKKRVCLTLPCWRC